MARPKSKRTDRRAKQRALEKLARQRERLARLEPGGSADHPLVVESASVIETRAESSQCFRCREPMRVTEHRAETGQSGRLRVVAVRCARCGAERTLYFRIRLLS